MGTILKNVKSVKNGKGNAYLFANLVLVIILLISIWTSKGNEFIARQLDVKNLLILVLIFNTLLLFKDFIISSKPSKQELQNLSNRRKLKSLSPLRAFINSSTPTDSSLLQKSIEKLKEISESDYVELAIIDNSISNTLVSAGVQPQLLAGSRLTISNSILSIKHSGQIGTEEITKLTDEFKPIKFRSSLTRLHLFIAPLNLSHARRGFCLFYTAKAQPIQV